MVLVLLVVVVAWWSWSWCGGGVCGGAFAGHQFSWISGELSIFWLNLQYWFQEFKSKNIIRRICSLLICATCHGFPYCSIAAVVVRMCRYQSFLQRRAHARHDQSWPRLASNVCIEMPIPLKFPENDVLTFSLGHSSQSQLFFVLTTVWYCLFIYVYLFSEDFHFSLWVKPPT